MHCFKTKAEMFLSITLKKTKSSKILNTNFLSSIFSKITLTFLFSFQTNGSMNSIVLAIK